MPFFIYMINSHVPLKMYIKIKDKK